MSGLISDNALLELEDARILGRTNLRKQGIACSDDIGIPEEMEKIDDIQSWKDYLNKTLSGFLYDTSITIATNSMFNQQIGITGVLFTALNETKADNSFGNCSSLELAILPSLTIIGPSTFQASHNLKIAITPRVSGSPNYNYSIFSTNTNLILCDLGSPTNINSNIGDTYLEKIIMRKADGITTLANASHINTNSLKFVPNLLISTYETSTNWSTQTGDFISLEGSRFEDLDWWETVYNTDGTPKNTCTLDGNLIETADNETVAIFKHTENISHCYENGVELQDTDLVKGKTLTSTI